MVDILLDESKSCRSMILIQPILRKFLQWADQCVAATSDRIFPGSAWRLHGTIRVIGRIKHSFRSLLDFPLDKAKMKSIVASSKQKMFSWIILNHHCLNDSAPNISELPASLCLCHLKYRFNIIFIIKFWCDDVFNQINIACIFSFLFVFIRFSE